MKVGQRGEGKEKGRERIDEGRKKAGKLNLHNEKNGFVNMTAMERQEPDFIRSGL